MGQIRAARAAALNWAWSGARALETASLEPERGMGPPSRPAGDAPVRVAPALDDRPVSFGVPGDESAITRRQNEGAAKDEFVAALMTRGGLTRFGMRINPKQRDTNGACRIGAFEPDAQTPRLADGGRKERGDGRRDVRQVLSRHPRP